MTETITRIEHGTGRITLNRPRALNALTLGMVRAIDAALAAWSEHPDVKLVLLDGAGERGLCAGGDIRALYDAVVAGDLSVPQEFFREEYRLNAHIARFPKPFVAFMDGIVMGGGIGVSAHASHRVVTERARLAMPETGIGFVPDVGGTWLLGHAPDELGTYAALAALQMGAADALLCGLADLCVPSTNLAALAEALRDCATHGEVDECLGRFATEAPPGVLGDARAWVGACFAGESVEAILQALARHPEAAAQRAAAEIAGKSPSSLRMALRALREARQHDALEQSLEQEYRLAMACMGRPDFREGVRAAIVDKDRNPAWSPATLQDVTPAEIEAIFTGPDYGGLGLGIPAECHRR
jgi:enoyl-CoA hydratase